MPPMTPALMILLCIEGDKLRHLIFIQFPKSFIFCQVQLAALLTPLFREEKTLFILLPAFLKADFMFYQIVIKYFNAKVFIFLTDISNEKDLPKYFFLLFTTDSFKLSASEIHSEIQLINRQEYLTLMTICFD